MSCNETRESYSWELFFFFFYIQHLLQVELKPDLEATEFSCQNAFFFAKMSKIAYLPKDQARSFLKGNKTNAGVGFDHFYWYEVRRSDIPVRGSLRCPHALLLLLILALYYTGTVQGTDIIIGNGLL